MRWIPVPEYSEIQIVLPGRDLSKQPATQRQTQTQKQSTSQPRPTGQVMEKRRATQATASRLASLRDLAQRHLVEIDEMARKEEMEERKRVTELEREAKRRERKDEAQSGGEGVEEKKEKLRTAQDVLDRIQWDPSFNPSEYRIGYLDRFGGIMEMNVAEWVKVREVTDEEFIPMHRIRWFKRVTMGTDGDEEGEEGTMKTEVVWHRDERVDRIFGGS